MFSLIQIECRKPHVSSISARRVVLDPEIQKYTLGVLYCINPNPNVNLNALRSHSA